MRVKATDSYQTAAQNLEGSVNLPAVKEERWVVAGYFHYRRHLKMKTQTKLMDFQCVTAIYWVQSVLSVLII